MIPGHRLKPKQAPAVAGSVKITYLWGDGGSRTFSPGPLQPKSITCIYVISCLFCYGVKASKRPMLWHNIDERGSTNRWSVSRYVVNLFQCGCTPTICAYGLRPAGMMTFVFADNEPQGGKKRLVARSILITHVEGAFEPTLSRGPCKIDTSPNPVGSGVKDPRQTAAYQKAAATPITTAT